MSGISEISSLIEQAQLGYIDGAKDDWDLRIQICLTFLVLKHVKSSHRPGFT